MKKNFFNAPYVRPEDSVFTAFCLYMLEVMAKPVVWWKAVLYPVLVFIVLLALVGLLNSLAPLWIAFGIAILSAILAIIGAVIRDKRMK